MSLKYMNCDTPETGSLSKQYIYWGSTNIPTIDNIQTTYNGGSDRGYLPNWTEYEGKEYNIPSLFDANGNWNLAELGTVNQFVVTDIDGKNKTEKILATATAQSNWRTATTIANKDYPAGYAPAACCCARYHTLGTQAGDWYLGAGGEISMIAVQEDTQINTKLAQIAAVYPNDCISSIESGYWSSTKYDDWGNAYFFYGDGEIYNGPDDDSYITVISMLQY